MAVVAVAAGVDTWSPSWRVRVDSPRAKALSQQAVIPSGRGGFLFPATTHPQYRVMWWPGSGLLKAEGHPVADGLAPVATLPRQLERLTGELQDAGIPAPDGFRRFKRFKESEGFSGLRRLDLTVDLRTGDRDEGRQLMGAVEAAARASGCFAPGWERRGKDGRTVYLAGDTGVFGRWYDKGAESGQAPAYRRIRPEAQWRFRDLENAPDEQTRLDDVDWMRERFAKRWGPGMRGVITVGDMTELGAKLAEAVRQKRITPAEARRIAGFLVMEPHGLDGIPYRTRARLASEVKKFGFHLVDGVLEPLEVDLGAVLEEAERADLWESGVSSQIEPPDEELAKFRRDVIDKHPARPKRESRN